jgi:hypothetical protein
VRIVRTYRMTIASFWYDAIAEHVQEYETHYKVAREGDIKEIREHLAKRGVPHFQQNIYRKFKTWIRKHKVRVSLARALISQVLSSSACGASSIFRVSPFFHV